jgi:two-component system alkaline phosphatase synthesis response regulator PhoP
MNDPALVLVVDDDPLLVDLVTHKLQARGFRVESAADGVAGLERARALKPDLVVLDQMMPMMDGREVLRELHADPDLSSVPIVMLTARRGESDVVNALALGASDFIPKPFSPDELAARVQRLLPKKTAAR